ncbi:MAG: hypothetical protein OEQ94_03590 [Nitrosopumilus sp.]|nr:hypothetical protein [Nitrosopumilus sp.]MDH3832907.1 hypothetical protein [Nitrosopumilus sp.]
MKQQILFRQDRKSQSNPQNSNYNTADFLQDSGLQVVNTDLMGLSWILIDEEY